MQVKEPPRHCMSSDLNTDIEPVIRKTQNLMGQNFDQAFNREIDSGPGPDNYL